jgi:hypothetical protein
MYFELDNDVVELLKHQDFNIAAFHSHICLFIYLFASGFVWTFYVVDAGFALLRDLGPQYCYLLIG